MNKALISTLLPSTVMPLGNLATAPKKAVVCLLLAGSASLASAAIITPQPGGAIDPSGGEEMDAEATGSVLLADFNALGGKVIQANWSNISGPTGNTIDGTDVDVRIAHTDNAFAASANATSAYNSSSVGNGYQWTGTDGQQLTVLFGTQDGSFSNNRTVRAAGLMLMNFGPAYTDVTITYFDSADGVLSTQSFSGGADVQGTGNGGDFFTGYISSSQNIAKVTIDISRDTGTSQIALDSLTYVVGPEMGSTLPSDNATDVALDTDLTATFTKDIVANTGSIELRLGSDDSVVESFDVTTDVSIVDNQVTINPTSDLSLNSEYYVLIPDGAFRDADGVDSAGVSDPATWSFSTAIPDSATIDFDPTGEFAAEFSAGGYSEDATGGLDSSVGVAIAGGSPGGVASLDGPQRSWAPSGTFSSGATMTVGAFFSASSLASGEVLRLGLTNGGTDNFASLPFASVNWTGTDAQLVIRENVATGPTTFSLSTGQWYYFEVSFTRGASNSILYELAVANADSSGNVGSTIESFSQQTGTNLDSTELNKAIYAGFRGMLAAGVLDNFYASSTGASQLSTGTSYAGWIALYEVGAETGIDQDPDGDGNDNGVENFFGTAPDGFSQGLVSGTVDAGAGTFTFTHPQGTLAADLAASYRWSTDLQSFNADGATDGDGTKVDFTVQLDTPEAGTTTVTATVDPGGTATDRLFVDVQVTQP